MEKRTAAFIEENIKAFDEAYVMHKTDVLGTGGWGTVYSGVRKKDNKDVAIKEVEKKNIVQWGLLNQCVVPMEIFLMHKVRHVKSVVHLLDYYETKEAFLIIMEKPSPAQDLFDYVKEQKYLSESVARNFFQQIVQTIIEIQLCGVVHRDIKDENILVNLHTKELKLIDFGTGAYLDQDLRKNFCGTKIYTPPEFMLNGLYYGMAATVWSLGMVLYSMVCGNIPFQHKKDVLQHKLFFPSGLSLEVMDLIKKCLSFRPYNRPSFNEILLHPWMKVKSLTIKML